MNVIDTLSCSPTHISRSGFLIKTHRCGIVWERRQKGGGGLTRLPALTAFCLRLQQRAFLHPLRRSLRFFCSTSRATIEPTSGKLMRENALQTHAPTRICRYFASNVRINGPLGPAGFNKRQVWWGRAWPLDGRAMALEVPGIVF